MYMRVHFFSVCCFPAAGVGPLAAARDLAAERGRTWLCHSACPQLLLPLPPWPLCRAPAWLILRPGAPQGLSGPSEEAMVLWLAPVPTCCWFTVMMLGRQQGPRVPALATPSQARDTPHLQAGERRNPSLSSGMCSCFPSGLQSCARAPPALALPLAKCCAIAGLCPRRWALTGYVFSTPIPEQPVLHACTHACVLVSVPL